MKLLIVRNWFTCGARGNASGGGFKGLDEA